MSTGYDCEFFILDEKHYYIIGEDSEVIHRCDVCGPFDSMEIADKHCTDNHANPGGNSKDTTHYKSTDDGSKRYVWAIKDAWK